MTPSAPTNKAMPVWKILLISGGLLVLVFVVGIIAVASWFNNNKDRMVADAKEAKVEAEAFAASHDQNACVEEALTRSERCEGINIVCTAKQQVFLSSCLETATSSATLCTGVPKPSEIMASANWAVAQCKKRGRSDQSCTNLHQAVARYCEAK